MDQAVPPAGDLPGKVTARRLALGTVSKIEVDGPGTLMVAAGTPGAVAVSAMPEDLERIEIKVDGDTLKLGFKGGMLLNRGPQGDVRYEVTASSAIEGLKVGHGVTGEVVGLEAKEIKIKVDGGSRLTLGNVRAGSFEVEAADGSQVVVSGAVERQKVKLGRGSRYQGTGLGSREAEVEAGDGAEASVRADEKIKARVSTGATVSYVGDGMELDVKVDMGGHLRQVAAG
jgi:hypothetical protein